MNFLTLRHAVNRSAVLMRKSFATALSSVPKPPIPVSLLSQSIECDVVEYLG